jgi:hypothetical protein
MATASEAPTSRAGAESSTRVSGRSLKWAIAGSVLLAGFGGVLIGSNRSDVMDLEGTAYVGDRVATIESGGWSYGVSESVAWIDASGSYHERGWPTCLGSTGSSPKVKFGAVAVTLPDSVTYRAVVYIDCRSE